LARRGTCSHTAHHDPLRGVPPHRGAGECDAAWHDLLAVLAEDRASGLEAAVRAVLAHGATSGADMLAGFVYPMRRSRTDGVGRCDLWRSVIERVVVRRDELRIDCRAEVVLALSEAPQWGSV